MRNAFDCNSAGSSGSCRQSCRSTKSREDRAKLAHAEGLDTFQRAFAACRDAGYTKKPSSLPSHLPTSFQLRFIMSDIDQTRDDQACIVCPTIEVSTLGGGASQSRRQWTNCSLAFALRLGHLIYSTAFLCFAGCW